MRRDIGKTVLGDERYEHRIYRSNEQSEIFASRH